MGRKKKHDFKLSLENYPVPEGTGKERVAQHPQGKMSCVLRCFIPELRKGMEQQAYNHLKNILCQPLGKFTDYIQQNL